MGRLFFGARISARLNTPMFFMPGFMDGRAMQCVSEVVQRKTSAVL
jgi:hypothetical protein